MRMYGKTRPNQPQVLGQPEQDQRLRATTLQRNTAAAEESKEKLENPYYYYGSTRNQKKSKQALLQQKPRPLLPSQRAQLESQARQTNTRRPDSRNNENIRPTSRSLQQAQEVKSL